MANPAVMLFVGCIQTERVLRGGAFKNNEDNLRCANRNRNNPNNRNNNNGFRIVLSTFFNLPGNAKWLRLLCRWKKMVGYEPCRALKNQAGKIPTAARPGSSWRAALHHHV